jgi:hypothetical protein
METTIKYPKPPSVSCAAFAVVATISGTLQATVDFLKANNPPN